MVFFRKTLANYVVNHRVASPYHHPTSVQVKLSNMEIKLILEKTVNRARSDLPTKNNDALYGLIELLLKILWVCLHIIWCTVRLVIFL
jgi:ketopantoate reductase